MIVEENAEGYWVDLTPVDLRGRPPIVSVVPAAIDFDHSFVWGESLGSLKAGVVGQFHVILVDHFDNVVGQSAGDLQAAVRRDFFLRFTIPQHQTRSNFFYFTYIEYKYLRS